MPIDFPRRTILAGSLMHPLLPRPAIARPAGPITATDVLGRTVTLPRPARRIVLGQGRHVVALGLLHPEPDSLLVAWGDEFRRTDPLEYARHRARFPALDRLPVLERGMGGAAAEQILAQAPDLVLLSRFAAMQNGGPAASPLFRAMDAARVPVAVIDFFAQPLADTEPSLALLGQVLGRQEQAEALLGFYRNRMDGVRRRMAGIGGAANGADRPLVFLHAHAGGTDCCFSPGRGVYDDFIRMAGGHNLGADLLTAPTGQLSLETVLTRDPAVYIATGGPYGGRGGVSLGTGADTATARASLEAAIASQHLGGLGAVRAGRAHAIWHGFNDTPAHVLMIEALARWLHPDRAGDLSPDAGQEELNRRFAALPMEGVYWVDLRG